jgi:predicted ATPase/tRNA A-37 threonylcarbamoyl transferase component Bud32
LQLIGRGGTGLVYEAEHVVLGRSAALKTLVPALLDDEEFRERLIRESRMVAALDHPTVIPIYDAGDTDGVLYVAMRLVRGPDLAELVDRGGRLDVETTVGLLEQVAGALDAAHASGLVHRDVKPANVLLEEATGRVYLSDFGIAKHADAAGLTRTGFFLGTIDSAAPEQIQGQPVGPPADVYAFGCTAYECLTGRPPFDRGSTGAILRAHISDPPPPLPRDLGLPTALDDVIARALAKEEWARYPTCGELMEDFRAASGIGRRTRAWTALHPTPPEATRLPPLPAETTPLFGRDAEVERLNELLRQPEIRLVTLTGLGGIGKTRLAIAGARTASDDFDEVAFVDLATATESEHLGLMLAQALGVAVADDESALDHIAYRLAGRRTLLVLDSFERVLPAASLLADLLGASPRLVALVTSQVALRLREEHRLPVPPLPLPDFSAAESPDQLLRAAPVALFADRARAAKPDFELTAENVAAVAGICTRLDGLPLPIELAAARVNVFTPQAILSRLDQRLAFLTEGASGLPDRQQTLRGAIDWTHDLLAERERVLFARLGVFAGGWSLEAAEAICSEPGSGVGELLNALASLVDNNLVRQDEGVEGEPRFTMLDTIREYALERLRDRGEDVELLRRHAGRYLALAETAEPELEGPGQLAWLERLREEEENVWAALAWTLTDRGDLETGLRITAALVRFWITQARTAPVRHWLEGALAGAEGVADPTLAKAQFAAGYAALCEGDLVPATEHFERSLELARSVGDARHEAAALAPLARVLLARGEADAARAAAERALEFAGAEADKATASVACNVLADIAAEEDEEPACTAFAERGMRLRRELGDRSLLASSLVDSARRAFSRREPAETAVLLHEGLELARTVGDAWIESIALTTLGALAVVEGNAVGARNVFRDALAVAHRRGDRRAVAECVHGLAAVSALEGDTHRAARLLGAAHALRDAAGAALSPVERALDRIADPRLSGTDGAVLDVERTAGELLQMEEIVVLALGGSVAVPA